MKNLGYYNGEIGLIEEMRVPMTDRACFFGDGVYDTALSHNGVIFALDEHIDRFFRSAGMLEMTPPLAKEALAGLLGDLCAKVDAPTKFVYWQLSRGTALREHAFRAGIKANLWVTVEPTGLHDTLKPVRLITVEDTRFLHCNIKTLNLIPNVLAAEKARRAGAAEAVFHRGDRVTECAHSNVHIIKDGVFQTPPADNLILGGITRAHLLAMCRKLGIPAKEEPFTVAQLFDADEVIVAACTSFCLPASHIDGKPVGGKSPELLKKLQDGMLAEFYEAVGIK
ncbi:MAG: aminotransferase class IV [Spirochaetaceae bacterium]|jgi:D-alanine transaminase|nr:aminotransferase class IV [Spirochaetaceae bacterium]